MYPNQQNQNGNGYPPYPQNGQPQQSGQQYGSHEVLPPLNNTGATGHNPYEFIMNPGKKSRGIGGGVAGGKNIVIILCVAVLMIVIVAATLMSALKPKGNVTQLTAIAQRQQEIIRISTDAAKKVSTQNASNFVLTTELVVTSSQTELLTYMSSHNGVKLKSATLRLDASPKTDTLLEDAASANNYDTTVVQVLSSQLNTYEALLKSAYNATNSKSGKELLQKTFTATEALQKQAEVAQPAS